MSAYCIVPSQRIARRLSPIGKPKSNPKFMKSREKIIVLVTCGSAKEAERLAEALVEKRLAACVTILQDPVKSIYRWKGRVETAREFFLLIKSSRANFLALSRQIEKLHSYETPEIIALTITAGSPEYLRWLDQSL
jgi:periplasmic divalent cation tolerance protein